MLLLYYLFSSGRRADRLRYVDVPIIYLRPYARWIDVRTPHRLDFYLIISEQTICFRDTGYMIRWIAFHCHLAWSIGTLIIIIIIIIRRRSSYSLLSSAGQSHRKYCRCPPSLTLVNSLLIFSMFSLSCSLTGYVWIHSIWINEREFYPKKTTDNLDETTLYEGRRVKCAWRVLAKMWTWQLQRVEMIGEKLRTCRTDLICITCAYVPVCTGIGDSLDRPWFMRL